VLKNYFEQGGHATNDNCESPNVWRKTCWRQVLARLSIDARLYRFLTADAIAFRCPLTEINHFAAFAAKWAVGLSLFHTTSLPHCGHVTTAGFFVMATGILQAAEGEVERYILLV